MAFINAFQSGQQFASLQDKRAQALEDAKQRSKGVAALAERFGDVALAPADFATVAGVGQRQEGLDIRKQQIAAQQERQSEQDRIAAEERDRANQLSAARNTINFFKSGIEQGVPVADIVDRAGPALQALGVADEQVQPLIEEIENNPQILDQLDAALAQQSTPRRAVGQPIAIRQPNGETALLQTFTDGSSEIIPNASPLDAELAEGRLNIAGRRTEVAEGTLAARLSENDRKVLKDTGAELKSIKEERNFNETTVNAANTVVRDVDTALDIADQAAGFGGNSMSEAVQRAVGAQVLSTDAREVQRLVDSVKSNIGIDSLLRIKRSGAGLGQVPQSQLETLQSLLGNLDITRDPALFLRDLQDIRELYNTIIAKANESNVTLDRRELQLLRRRNTIEQRNFGDEPGEEPSLDELLDKFAPTGG